MMKMNKWSFGIATSVLTLSAISSAVVYSLLIEPNMQKHTSSQQVSPGLVSPTQDSQLTSLTEVLTERSPLLPAQSLGDIISQPFNTGLFPFSLWSAHSPSGTSLPADNCHTGKDHDSVPLPTYSQLPPIIFEEDMAKYEKCSDLPTHDQISSWRHAFLELGMIPSLNGCYPRERTLDRRNLEDALSTSRDITPRVNKLVIARCTESEALEIAYDIRNILIDTRDPAVLHNFVTHQVFLWGESIFSPLTIRYMQVEPENLKQIDIMIPVFGAYLWCSHSHMFYPKTPLIDLMGDYMKLRAQMSPDFLNSAQNTWQDYLLIQQIPLDEN